MRGAGEEVRVGASEAFRFSVERSDDTALVRLDGELDCATAPELDAALGELFRGATLHRLEFDAERLSFMDVAGLRPLVRAGQQLPGGVFLRNAPAKVLHVVRLLQFDRLLGVDA